MRMRLSFDRMWQRSETETSGGTARMAVSRCDRMIHHAGSTEVKALFLCHAEGVASSAFGTQPFWLGHPVVITGWPCLLANRVVQRQEKLPRIQPLVLRTQVASNLCHPQLSESTGATRVKVAHFSKAEAQSTILNETIAWAQ
jgi:hypothetical protein